MTTNVRSLLQYREFSILAMLLLVALYLTYSSDYFLSQRNLMAGC